LNPGRARFLIPILSFAAGRASAQLPAPAILPESDSKSFHAEIARIEKLPPSAADESIVTYQIARIWASAEQWPEAVSWLRKAVALKAGLDPSRDPVFEPLRNTREFTEILGVVREATGPVSRSRLAFQVRQGDLVPESVAWDPKGRRFYFGSMRKGKVIRCTVSGACTPFAGGLGVVLGLKISGGALWLLSNSDRESALLRYDTASTRLTGKYAITGAGHSFNDLTVAPNGAVYVTDTPAGTVWYLANGSASLAKLPGKFDAANGLALSPNGGLLYVSTYPAGVTVVDLKTGAASPLARPAGLCLALIDGLYFHGGSLIAIQNGFMAPRVVRLALAHDLRGVEGFEVLERGNALFDGLTTGVIAGREFFYMANIQDEKTSGFLPISILRLRL
jgi:hypothetical protein